MLEVDGLVKAFGGFRAVDGCSLCVGQGEILGLIGPNGAGKTTLFNLIAGALQPTSGTIRFLGEDITRCPPTRASTRDWCAPSRSRTSSTTSACART